MSNKNSEEEAEKPLSPLLKFFLNIPQEITEEENLTDFVEYDFC